MHANKIKIMNRIFLVNFPLFFLFSGFLLFSSNIFVSLRPLILCHLVHLFCVISSTYFVSFRPLILCHWLSLPCFRPVVFRLFPTITNKGHKKIIAIC